MTRLRRVIPWPSNRAPVARLTVRSPTSPTPTRSHHRRRPTVTQRPSPRRPAAQACPGHLVQAQPNPTHLVPAQPNLPRRTHRPSEGGVAGGGQPLVPGAVGGGPTATANPVDALAPRRRPLRPTLRPHLRLRATAPSTGDASPRHTDPSPAGRPGHAWTRRDAQPGFPA